MKKQLLLFLFAIVAGFGTLSAWDYKHVQIGILYYNLDASNMIASVTSELSESPQNYLGLTSIGIPSHVNYNGADYSVTSIGSRAFYNCSGLISVTIPNSVTDIESSAFSHCSSLTSATIPNSVTNIGMAAFFSCSSLTSMTIPNNVTSIGERAFYRCSSLASITVETGNTVYDSRDDCNAIIETAANTLVAGCHNTVIPSSVTSIGSYALGYCSLISVTIPSSVTSIGNCAFYGCSILTSVTIPNSVTIIGNKAFSDCESLKNVVLGTSLKNIENAAFYGCPIDTIKCYSNRPPTVGNDAFTMPYSTIIFVPAEYLTYYQMHDFWGLYDVRQIEESAGGETIYVTVNYEAKDGAELSNEPLTLHFPEAPDVEGFTFLGWQPVAEIINGSITIQAVYKSIATSYFPASVSIPNNPTQKLIRYGNVYILRGDNTYSVHGQEVR